MVIEIGFENIRKKRIEELKIWITQRLEQDEKQDENITYDDALIFAMSEWGLSRGKAQELLDFSVMTGNFYVDSENKIRFKLK